MSKQHIEETFYENLDSEFEYNFEYNLLWQI